MTRSFFFYHGAKEARKSRGRRRIRTEQKSPMGIRPLDESAPSARQISINVGYCLGHTSPNYTLGIFVIYRKKREK